MKYQPFAFWLFSLCCGILLARTLDIPLVYIGVCLFISALGVWLNYYLFKGSRLGILSLLFCFFLGFFSYKRVNQNIVSDKGSQSKVFYEVEIQKQLKESAKHHKYLAQIINVNKPKEKSFEKKRIILYLPKTNDNLYDTDHVWVKGFIVPVSAAANPHQFNYKRYLLDQGVGLQSFADTILYRSSANHKSLAYKRSVFKRKIDTQLQKKQLSLASLRFIKALGLGDRNDFDTEWVYQLSTAGVMHVFAISGLHVGIVFFFVMLLFYPLLFLPKGRFIRLIFSLLFLWFYAWFIGFTPSVTRAAFMLTMYYVGFILQRNNNVFHTLAFTAFVLLLIHPNHLFSVGFQLSYTAVFFILWSYRYLKHYRNRVGRKFRRLYDLFVVTTSAQMGVMPISIYYFHAFSGVFLLSNVLLLPLVSFLIGLSILSIILIYLGWWSPVMAYAVNFVFDHVEQFISWTASHHFLIGTDIHWNLAECLFWLSLMMYLPYFILNFSYKKLKIIFVLIIALQISRFYDVFKFSHKSEMVIFNQNKASIIGVREGRKLYVFQQTSDSLKTWNYVLSPYLINEEIREISFLPIMASARGNTFDKRQNILIYKGRTLVVNPRQKELNPEIDYVLKIQDFSLKNTAFSPRQVLIKDGSNSFRRKENNPGIRHIYHTRNGAFILK